MLVGRCHVCGFAGVAFLCVVVCLVVWCAFFRWIRFISVQSSVRCVLTVRSFELLTLFAWALFVSIVFWGLFCVCFFASMFT